ncbi:hypothetical protein M9Y10_043590 [Tritrichomonas musculus]|uniref:Uncharacterized protein n=1 Tax=Tritrichomonas musculus TaxID=1915356 RepID=A0ABR2K152_9EUKA
MRNSYLIESSLMRSIIDKELPKGLVSDGEISQMSEEEKRDLYQKQKTIIQEFQKRSDQEINSCTSILRNLNENLLLLRKNQLKNNRTNKQTSNQQVETQVKEKRKEHQHLESPRPPKTTRNHPKLQKQLSLSIPTQKKQIKNYKPPFRH